MTSSRIRRIVARSLLVTVLVAQVAGTFATWHVATAQGNQLDLAAVIMHPDDLDWLIAEQERQGQLDNAPYVTDLSLYFTTVDEVLASPYYAQGRGGFVAAEAEAVDLGEVLEDSDWVRTMNAFMVRQASLEGSWIDGIGVTIEEYESADGAEAAFAAFNDPEPLAEIAMADDVDALAAPDLGDEQAMWSFQSVHWGAPPIPVITLWVRIDNLIVSVAAVDASEITEPDPAVVERLMEFQLKRLEHAEHLYGPNLAACAPRLAGEAIRTLNDDYAMLNGKNFGAWFDTYDVIEEDQAAAWAYGMVDRHRVRQIISGTSSGASDGLLYYTGTTRAFGDAGQATAYVDALEDVLREEDRSDVAELDDVPSLGDAARAFTYVGGSGAPSTVVYVQVDALVLSFYLGPSTEPLPGPAYDLAEAYLDHLEGDCGQPMDAPSDL